MSWMVALSMMLFPLWTALADTGWHEFSREWRSKAFQNDGNPATRMFAKLEMFDVWDPSINDDSERFCIWMISRPFQFEIVPPSDPKPTMLMCGFMSPPGNPRGAVRVFSIRRYFDANGVRHNELKWFKFPGDPNPSLPTELRFRQRVITRPDGLKVMRAAVFFNGQWKNIGALGPDQGVHPDDGLIWWPKLGFAAKNVERAPDRHPDFRNLFGSRFLQIFLIKFDGNLPSSGWATDHWQVDGTPDPYALTAGGVDNFAGFYTGVEPGDPHRHVLPFPAEAISTQFLDDPAIFLSDEPPPEA